MKAGRIETIQTDNETAQTVEQTAQLPQLPKLPQLPQLPVVMDLDRAEQGASDSPANTLQQGNIKCKFIY